MEEFWVTDRYHKLRGLWLELDNYQSLQSKCVPDAVKLKKMI
jgi:hypothetical protein